MPLYNKAMLMRPDHRVRQRDFLLEISRAITAQLDLTEVLRRVLYASVVMLAGRVGLVALRSDNDGEFYVRALSGIPQERVPDLNQKLHDIFSQSDELANSEYLDAKLREMATLIDEDLAQSVAMPLVFAEQPLGVLIVFRSYKTTITPDDLLVLQSFADQAAIAVHNAQLYERINYERGRLQAILDHSGDGVMILDSHLEILHINTAMEQITGWSSDEAVGHYQEEVIVWQSLESQDLPEAIDEGLVFESQQKDEATQSFYVEGDLLRRDGLTVSIGITYAPLFDKEGQLVNIIANVRDISNWRKVQEMQNVFISTIHHELRTPIALIKGYASTLRRSDVDWDKHIIQENLEIIEDEADRLTTLIEDLLTASKIQAEQEVDLNLADVRLDWVATRAVERIGSQNTSHDIRLSFPDNFPAVHGDEARLRQVIDNLLTNAIKYSPANTSITVGGRFNEKSVSVFVRDQGAGIPEREQRRIFERFYRIDDHLTRRTQGTGLGLYLAKAIITAHGGTIHIKSQVGQGSTFYFTIPRD